MDVLQTVEVRLGGGVTIFRMSAPARRWREKVERQRSRSDMNIGSDRPCSARDDVQTRTIARERRKRVGEITARRGPGCQH